MTSIALVEDDPAYGRIARVDLGRAGYHATLFNSRESFEASLTESTPALVICDSFTLEEHNIGMYETLKKREPSAPVLLISGGLEANQPYAERNRARAASAGISHFWHKGSESFEDVSLGTIEPIALVELVRRLVPLKIGQMLADAILEFERTPEDELESVVQFHDGRLENGRVVLPVMVSVDCKPGRPDEKWPEYRLRVAEEMREVKELLETYPGGDVNQMIAGNALSGHVPRDLINHLASHPRVKQVELNPTIEFAQVADSARAVGLVTPTGDRHPLNGKGVRLAILDSGVDIEHPSLQGGVILSADLTGEGLHIAGDHGTHVAGIVGSRSDKWPGFASGASLLNIKVFNSKQSGTRDNFLLGIDLALDNRAEIISFSGGIPLLPRVTNLGVIKPGYNALGGSCPLCMAVKRAVLENVVVVVASGNYHEKAEALRQKKFGHLITTELSAPGLLDEVITVGAITKDPEPVRAGFSSFGKSPSGQEKPDLVAPGKGVVSTLPVPRNADRSFASAAEENLFGPMDGTSMATPMVAAVVAILIQQRKQVGRSWTPEEIKQELLTEYVRGIPGQPGTGRGALSFPVARA